MNPVFPSGRLRVSPADPVPAGSSGTWTITLELDGLPKGGAVEIILPHGWSGPQTADPKGGGFLAPSPEIREAFDLALELNRVLLRARREIERGFSGRLVWGDRSQGGPGVAASDMASFASEAVETFYASADPEGTGAFLDFAEFPRVPVRPCPASRLSVQAPFEAVAGRPVLARLSALDDFGNVDPSFEGEALLALEGGGRTAVRFSRADRGLRSAEVTFEAPGLKAISAEAPAAGFKALSPTVRVHAAPPPLRVFFGDLHGHTTLTDANLDPEGYYRYARDVAGLDFSAITDHDWVLNRTRKEPMKALDAAGYEAIRRANEAFYDPGRFVTLLGYEWIRPDPNRGTLDMNYGHMTIVYPDNEGPIFWPSSTDTGDPWRIAERVRGLRCLLIPHQTLYASPDHLERRIEMEQFRLVEIFSSWGNSESDDARLVTRRTRDRIRKRPRKGESVVDYLKSGYRFGIFCSSDAHSYPSRMLRRKPWRREGGDSLVSHGFALCGVYARELTREGIFEALWNRRCFGTTGARIAVSLRVNGAFMGEALPAKGNEARRIEAEAVGAEELDAFDLVRNGETIRTERAGGVEGRAAWDDRPSGGPFDFYYLRVLQRDGEIAWSSPVWVGRPEGS